MSLIAELKRRNVIRMAGLFLVGAWLVVQVAGTLLPVFAAPSWVMKTLVGLLAIGFLAALVVAWVFELTPDGLKRDEQVSAEQSIAPQTAQRMNRMIVALLVSAVVYFVFDKFVLAPKREAALVATTSQVVKAETLASAEATVSDNSIAVLPFVDMS
ncbi:MAG: adenylyl cyclase, partial [Gammaproteobacteria bacterium]|nr:adenylyl cyclase [Gammaproteobacteria bacterium]